MSYFKNLKIGPKLIALFLIVGLLPMSITAWRDYVQTNEALQKDAGDKLEAIMAIKKGQIEGWFGERFGDVEVLSSFYEVIDATEKFEWAFDNGGTGGDNYRQVQDYFNPVLSKYEKTYGYYDLFLMDKKGNVVYTAEHEPDFGENISDGQYRNSGLGKAFRGAMNGRITLTDFESYAPSNGAAASFIAAPVKKDGQIIGAVALQMPLAAINKVMQEKTGMGESGETYLVGADFLMRSDSRFEKESTVLKNKVESLGVKQALDGKTAVEIYPDYRGIDVWGAYSKLDIEAFDWAIIAEIDDEEVMSPLVHIRNNVFILLGIIGALVAFIAVIMARSISKPIAAMAVIAQELALGDIDQQVEVTSKDEIGDLGEAFQQIIEAQKEMADASDSLAKGDLDVQINPRSEKDVMSLSLKGMVEVIKNMVSETNNLVEATKLGKLETRGNAEAFEGGFKELVKGINDLIQAFVDPINVTSDYVSRISKGDIPPEITDTYKGDFGIIKENLNQCVEIMSSLLTETDALVIASKNGKLDTRGEAAKFPGGWGQLVGGINDILDAVIAPITEASNVLELLAERDLTARVTGNYQGDHAKIKDNLNLTASALDEAMSQVAEAVAQVSAAGTQIASSSQSVAEGSSEQASSLEETSSSLEEMSSMTKQNADNAKQANIMAGETQKTSQEGGQAMVQMIEAMGKIKQSANGTAAIIKDINEIAFQTNLLALNAAVEAARAGEAGRGFAVVAEEVRNLALRSKDAASKTDRLIKESVDLSEDGEKISSEVNEKLSIIVESVGKVNDIIGEISTASEEQSNGLDQINTAVAQMDQVTQQNAANSEESSSASEELASQAQELAAMVGRFKVTRSSAGNMASASVPVVTNKKPAQLQKAANHGIALNAEDIIPMDDDPDFAEF